MEYGQFVGGDDMSGTLPIL